ncbi:MinD/ParA family protein [Selenomonas flueggei]|uniref:CobQ/CobB/MinD/ParA nucleotide binding domain protein n=1 Tax=Selenomonas flueggei ATCC 43531 TaxID=638302 RepID=C4V499_9FIRM|nr:MinD/ParA family protein [Selenomonas flueggei]EEQ48363.1 CobQ/CobB/MinD/ParA nucleotide binding domain protein [Selenomonas flueggei ATCC 43531]
MTDQATRLRQMVGAEGEAAHAAVQTQPTLSSAQVNAWADVRVVAVTSGKGGVGKTNIAVNLAIALRSKGYRVLVIDADLGMANVDVLLGVSSRRNLLDLLRPDVSLDDVIVETSHGVQYISGGSGIEKALEYDRAEKLLLQQKLADCAARADVILVDTGAGLGRNVMDFILAADEVLLVTTPEPTSLTDAYAVMKAYSIYASQKNLRLVINRVYEPKESREVALKLQRAAEKFLRMSVDCLGYVFEDASVTKSVRRQQPLIKAAPSSAAARCIDALADALITGEEMQVKRGWKGFLQQIFNFSA